MDAREDLSGSAGLGGWPREAGLQAVPSSTARPRTRMVRRRPWWTSAALVLGFDVGALVAATAFTGTWSLLGGMYVLGALTVLYRTGSYRLPLSLSALDQVPSLVPRLATPVVPLAALILFPAWRSDEAALGLLAQALISTALLCCGRAISFKLVRRGRVRGDLSQPTILVGGGHVGGELARALRGHPHYGLHPIGYLDEDDSDIDLPRLGTVKDLERVVTEHQVRRVVVAFSSVPDQALIDALRSAGQMRLSIHLVPRLFEVGWPVGESGTDEVWGIPVRELPPPATHRPGWQAKKVFDAAIAGLTLVTLSPLLAVIAVAVRLSGPGPILYCQPRVGQHGREFQMLKFRTLHVWASHTQWSVPDEAQTTVGRILRQTSLDELPQLWNILKGDMSIVGPRPERTFWVNQFINSISGYGARHRVPTGLTGWAQLNGLRGDTSIDQRVRLDNAYIENWSLWRDFVIIWRTIVMFFVHAPARPHIIDLEGSPPTREEGDVTARRDLSAKEVGSSRVTLRDG